MICRLVILLSAAVTGQQFRAMAVGLGSPAREGRDLFIAPVDAVPLLTQRATTANDLKPKS